MPDWVREDEEVHCLSVRLGAAGGALRALVQGLGGARWDWQAWDERHRAPRRWGVVDTPERAKGEAERAMADLMRQVDRVA